jgi:hypothetical protein
MKHDKMVKDPDILTSRCRIFCYGGLFLSPISRGWGEISKKNSDITSKLYIFQQMVLE